MFYWSYHCAGDREPARLTSRRTWASLAVDRLTMRASEGSGDLILSPSKDEVRPPPAGCVS